jgi:hypothetical protein
MNTSYSITIILFVIMFSGWCRCWQFPHRHVPEVKKVSGIRLSGHTFVIITHKNQLIILLSYEHKPDILTVCGNKSVLAGF